MIDFLPIAGVALIAAAPAADSAALYAEAVAARRSGDSARAIALLRQLVAAEPANADAQLQLGLALSAADHGAEAEAALRRTLELAPQYDDARIALARLARRRGDRPAALAALADVRGGNPEATELRTQLDRENSSPALWQIDLDSSYAAVSGAGDWREGTLGMRYRPGAALSAAARLELSRRFRATDSYGELRLDRQLSGAASAYATIGATPNASFRPKYQIGAGGSLRLRSGPTATVATIDARHARYAAGNIQTLAPGVEQYVANGRAWLTARWINVFDETGRRRSGWLARGDFSAREGLRLFAGVADAPDLSEGFVIRTLGLFGGISAEIGPRTTLRLSLNHDDRESGNDRTQLGLGLGWRF